MSVMDSPSRCVTGGVEAEEWNGDNSFETRTEEEDDGGGGGCVYTLCNTDDMFDE